MVWIILEAYIYLAFTVERNYLKTVASNIRVDSGTLNNYVDLGLPLFQEKV